MSVQQANADAQDEDLFSHYLEWTEQSLSRLRELLDKLPLRDRSADEMAKAMHSIAHDVKGMGGSFDFPLMSKIGASLCAYLRALPADAYPLEDVIAAHVRAMDVVLGNRITGDGGDSGDRLIAHLADIQGPIPY